MIRCLFVCLGNICRSPAAEGVMRSFVAKAGLTERIEIDSAGTGDWHVGQPPDPRMRAKAAERGYQLESRARQFQGLKEFEKFDYIIAMDNKNFQNIIKFTDDGNPSLRMMCEFLHRKDFEEIPDPYYGGEQGFALVLDLLEEACQGLIQEIRETHSL